MKYAVAILSVLVVALAWYALTVEPFTYVTCRSVGPAGDLTCSEVTAVGTWTCDEEGLDLHVQLVASEIAWDGPRRIRWDELPSSCTGGE